MSGCHGYRSWDEQRHATRTASGAGREDERIGDAERRTVVDALAAHLAAGRVDIGEYEERIEQVFAARTRADLRPPLAGLPDVALSDPAARQAVRAGFARHAASFAAIAAGLVLLWVLTGAGWFWPVWPLGWLAFGLVGHASRARARDAGTVTVRGSTPAPAG